MSKNINHIPVFIYGATVTALGIAHKLGNKAIVIERTGFAGREFADCYNPGDKLDKSDFSQDTQELREELVRRNILADSRMHIQGVAPVLFNRIKEEKLNSLFMTEVTDIKDLDEGYEITIYNNSGFQKLHTKAIIDTTSLCETSPSNASGIISKSINATLCPTLKDYTFPKSENPLAEFIQGRFDDEVYLKYKLDTEDDWITAREKLIKFWLSRDEELKCWNMAAIASSFDIKVNAKPTEIKKNWYWNPSSANSNVLEAYEAGISFSMGLQSV